MRKEEKTYTYKEVDEHICLWKPNSRFKNLLGIVAGEFEVIKLYGKEKHHTKWFCRCSCGRIVLRSTNTLSGRAAYHCCFCASSKFKQKFKDNPKVIPSERMLQIHRKFPHVDLLTTETRRWTFYCNKCKTKFREAQSQIFLDDYRGTPCRCADQAKFTQWTEYQRLMQIKERCKLINAKFIKWDTEEGYTKNTSRFWLGCLKNPLHKPWSASINNFLGTPLYGCPDCGVLTRAKSIKNSLDELKTLGTEIHKGKFLYHDYVYLNSRTPSKVWCTVCEDSFNVSFDNHINKKRGCPYCKGKTQKQCYLILIEDCGIPIAIKYGIATHTENRLKDHIRGSKFNLKLLGTWFYEESIDCKSAELEVKRSVEGSVLSKEDFFCNTETTWVGNLEKIITIYKKHGGNLR